MDMVLFRLSTVRRARAPRTTRAARGPRPWRGPPCSRNRVSRALLLRRCVLANLGTPNSEGWKRPAERRRARERPRCEKRCEHRSPRRHRTKTARKTSLTMSWTQCHHIFLHVRRKRYTPHLRCVEHKSIIITSHIRLWQSRVSCVPGGLWLSRARSSLARDRSISFVSVPARPKQLVPKPATRPRVRGPP